MCGILVYRTALGVSAEFAASLESLRRRGPDAFVERIIGDYTFVFSRLAVISSGGTDGAVSDWSKPDISGNQPLEKDGWYVLCNGEIFNYKVLAAECGVPLSEFRCDIDILHYLRRCGVPETWYSRLNGDFAAVMYNPAENRIIAFRDPAGVRPLYMALDSEQCPIAFSSLVQPLEALGVGSGSGRIVRVSEFPPSTIYDSARSGEPFLPQTFMPLEKDTELVSRDEFVLTPVGDFTRHIMTEGVRQYLYSAVRRRLLHSNVPVAFLCSGGLDSSILLAIGLQIWTTELHQPADKLQVFTVEFKDKHCGASDSFYASLLTKELGVRHTIIQFSEEDIRSELDNIIRTIESDDHRSVRAGIPQYFMAKWISQNTDYKVIISGEGADELFFGYNYFHLCPSQQDAETEGRRLIQNIHRYDVLRADRTISNWGLELRVPFLDTDFVKFVYSIPASIRYTGEFINDGPFSQYTPCEKKLLRESFKNHYALQRTRIIDRVKEKFSDGCGLTYIPALIRVMASKYLPAETVANTSVHLMEKYESLYVKEVMSRSLKLPIDSNKDFRELPKWAEISNTRNRGSDVIGFASGAVRNDVEYSAPVPLSYTPYVPISDVGSSEQNEGTRLEDLESNIESFEAMIDELMEKQNDNMLDKTKCSITAKNIYNYLITRFGALPSDRISWNDTLVSNSDSIINLDSLIAALKDEPMRTKIAYVYYDHMTGETSHYFILFCFKENIYWFQSAVMEYCMADFILGSCEETAPAILATTEDEETVEGHHAYFANQQALRDWNLRKDVLSRIDACSMSHGRSTTIDKFCEEMVPQLSALEGSWAEGAEEKCKLYTSLFACATNPSKIKNEKKMAQFRIKLWAE